MHVPDDAHEVLALLRREGAQHGAGVLEGTAGQGLLADAEGVSQLAELHDVHAHADGARDRGAGGEDALASHAHHEAARSRGRAHGDGDGLLLAERLQGHVEFVGGCSASAGGIDAQQHALHIVALGDGLDPPEQLHVVADDAVDADQGDALLAGRAVVVRGDRAEADEDEPTEIKVKVACGCEAVQNMMKELGDTLDAYEVCLQKPGRGPLFDYAAEHFPVHVVCPVITGITKCVEAEAQLALKHDVTIEFVD